MKKILFIFSFLILWTSPLKAQINFGDIHVSSMEELFNPNNNTLWGEKTNTNNYSFTYKGSDIWTRHKFSVLIINKKPGEKNRINLIANSRVEFEVLKDSLVPQLNRQFGNSKEVSVKHPFVISDDAKVEMITWTFTENEHLYEIYFGKTYPTISLIIYQSEISSY